jgi:hypothetical protein
MAEKRKIGLLQFGFTKKGRKAKEEEVSDHDSMKNDDTEIKGKVKGENASK